MMQMPSSRQPSPCLGCPDKIPACSDHCTKPEYLAWKSEQNLIRENRKKYRPNIWKHAEKGGKHHGF